MTFDINSLTIGQAKELTAIFGGATKPARGDNPMIGRHVVARTSTAGVHIGTVVQSLGEEVYLLKDARRLWKWDGAFTLSEVPLDWHRPQEQPPSGIGSGNPTDEC